MLGVLGLRAPEADGTLDPTLLSSRWRPWPTRPPWHWSGCGWPTQSARNAAMEETQAASDGAAELVEPRPAHATDRHTRRGRDAAFESWDTLAPDGAGGPAGQSIEQDTARMGRFLANIMDLTRLESGQIAAAPGTGLDVAEVIEAAIARVPDAAACRRGAARPRHLARPGRRGVAGAGAGERAGQRGEVRAGRRPMPPCASPPVRGASGRAEVVHRRGR